MAHQNIRVAITLVLVTMLWTGATAQTDCTEELISMSPCYSYITGNSSTPSSGCCTQLANVAQSKPECLCQVFSSGGSPLGIQVNQTQAEALSGACNVQTPPLSSCNRPASKSGSTNSGSSDESTTRVAAPVLFFLLFLASYALA